LIKILNEDFTIFSFDFDFQGVLAKEDRRSRFFALGGKAMMQKQKAKSVFPPSVRQYKFHFRFMGE